MSTKTKLVVHTLIRNEARWVWYALNSVLDLADEIMVWDTGSDDSTPEIVSSIKSPKIKFKEIGRVDPAGHTAARQQMLESTDSDWILILDGDEIWYQDSLRSCRDTLASDPSCSAIISPFINLVGDIYHYQDPRRSHYQIAGLSGPYNIRFLNRTIPGLHVGNPHGRQEYRNADEVPVQSLPSERLPFVNKPYLHTTHLPRSLSRTGDTTTLKRGFKFRYDLGHRFADNFIYPEVLYLPRPKNVPDPWFYRPAGFINRSLLYEPARILKSTFTSSGSKGY